LVMGLDEGLIAGWIEMGFVSGFPDSG